MFAFISVPAQVVWISESQPFVLKNCVTLSCVVNGHPAPYVAWLSPSGALLQNRTSPSDTNLTIARVTRREVGVYTCVASNQYGTVTRQTSILCESDSKATVLYI